MYACISMCIFMYAVVSKKAQGSNALDSCFINSFLNTIIKVKSHLCLWTLWSKSEYVFMYCLMGIKQLSTIDKCNKNVSSLRNTEDTGVIESSRKCNLLTLTLHAD